MALILSIETSTKVSSVALHREGTLVAAQSIHVQNSHSEILVPSIKYLCEISNVAINHIEAVAISKGPGSYTGLRIGTSTAKGLCYGLDIPLISVNTLEAMGYGIKNYFDQEHLLCPMLDARRMEVYCLIMKTNGLISSETEAKVIDESSFGNILREHKTVFFGPGAAKCKPVLAHQPNAVFIDDFHPSARHLGAIAWKKFHENQFEDLAYFEPFYLKDFIAKKPSHRNLV